MRLQLVSRTIAWVAIVAVLLLTLTGPRIPGWLLSVAVVSAIALGIPASMKQKRMENEAVHRLWRERPQ